MKNTIILNGIDGKPLYELNRDDNQFTVYKLNIVQEDKKVAGKDVKAGTIGRSFVGYYTKVEHMAKAIVMKELLDIDASSLSELSKLVEKSVKALGNKIEVKAKEGK